MTIQGQYERSKSQHASGSVAPTKNASTISLTRGHRLVDNSHALTSSEDEDLYSGIGVYKSTPPLRNWRIPVALTPEVTSHDDPDEQVPKRKPRPVVERRGLVGKKEAHQIACD